MYLVQYLHFSLLLLCFYCGVQLVELLLIVFSVRHSKTTAEYNVHATTAKRRNLFTSHRAYDNGLSIMWHVQAKKAVLPTASTHMKSSLRLSNRFCADADAHCTRQPIERHAGQFAESLSTTKTPPANDTTRYTTVARARRKRSRSCK